MRHDNFIPSLTAITSRGRLPHWQADKCDLLHHVPIARLATARCDPQPDRGPIAHHQTCANASERTKLDRAFSLRLDLELDRGIGSCLLRDHAELIANALKHFDGTRYDLHAWCVMPNHVHVLLHVQRGHDVPAIVHSWKSFTAHQIGRGVIWQREYFDRLIRNPQDFANTAAYIRNNPAKAGLRDWPWVG